MNNASSSGAIDNLGNNTTVKANSTITSDVASAGTGNTYTLGTLSIGNQILTVQGGSHVNGGTAGVTFSTGSLTGNTTFTVNNPAGGGATLLTFTGAINPSGTDTITFNGTGNTTVTGAIGNSTASAVTASGSGTLTLNAAETYTGLTTVSNGATINLGGGGAHGSLASSTLTLSGGAFNYTVTGNQTQNITTTNVNPGYTVVSAASGDTLNLGAITRTTGGMVNFGSTTVGSVTTSNANSANVILGGWATFGNGTGTQFAVANGAGSAITGFSSYNQALGAGWYYDHLPQ